MRIAVAGGSGFIGRQLTSALVAAGHAVVTLTRKPPAFRGAGEAAAADVHHPETLAGALAGCDIAYYLVHSLGQRDFERLDAAAGAAFGAASAGAGVRRVIYLGALGDPADELSPHLRSRQQVETILGTSGVPVTTLRAGIVVGDGGASWEIIRNLVERIPAMVVPSWAQTRTQPIALADAVRYLTAVLDLDDDGSQMYEIGGAEVLRYTQLLGRLAALEGRPSLLFPLPVPSTRLARLLSSQLLPLVTGVDRSTVQALIESMRNEVIVRDQRIRERIPFVPMDYDAAALAALGARARRRRAA